MKILYPETCRPPPSTQVACCVYGNGRGFVSDARSGGVRIPGGPRLNLSRSLSRDEDRERARGLAACGPTGVNAFARAAGVGMDPSGGMHLSDRWPDCVGSVAPVFGIRTSDTSFSGFVEPVDSGAAFVATVSADESGTAVAP